MTQVQTHFARTHIGVQKTSFIWSIDDFSKLPPNQPASIIVEPLSLQMYLYFTGGAIGDENLEIVIRQLEAKRNNHSSCRISLLDGDGKMVESAEHEHRFNGDSTNVWRFPSFITKSMLLKRRSACLPNDVLNLRCSFSTSFGIIMNQIEDYGHTACQSVKTTGQSVLSDLFSSNENRNISCSLTMKGALQRLYGDKIHSDVSLQSGNGLFPAHKAILSVRSPVFGAMFQREMLENQTGVVDISDLEPSTVDQLLTFIYTETVKDSRWEDIVKLYAAADKYDISQLTEECSSFLRSNINQSNVIELLVLSDRHGNSTLKTTAQDFILRNGREICETAEWAVLLNDNPLLAAETMQRIFKKKKN